METANALEKKAIKAFDSLDLTGKEYVFEQFDAEIKRRLLLGMLARMTSKDRRSILSELRISRPQIRELRASCDFSSFYTSKFLEVEKRSTNFGNEIRLKFNPGATFGKIFDDINERSLREHGRLAVNLERVYSSSLEDEISHAKAVTFISVFKTSRKLALLGSGDSSFLNFLEPYDFTLVDPLCLIAAAGALRAAKGFDKPRRSKNRGDLFEGWPVRSSTGVVLELELGLQCGRDRSCNDMIVALAALTSKEESA